MRIAWLVCLVACGSSQSIQWGKLEAAVDTMCKCTTKECMDRESNGWWDLPWPDLRGETKANHDRSTGIGKRGSRCMLEFYAKDDIARFGAWATRTCACQDAACQNAVDDEIVEWIEKQEHEPSRGPILSAARAQVLEHDRCFAKLAGATPLVEPATLPSTIPERVRASADLVCACSTMACADLYDHELVDWIQAQHYNISKDPTTGQILSGPAKDANTRLQKCHADKSTKWPHGTRVLGTYGIDG